MEKVYFLLLLCLFTGCDLFDKEEEFPTFIHISRADLITESLQGANTFDIPDVHVFANNNFMGVFELPANVPIYETGTVELNINAGIKKNGISSRRIIYPFYAPIVRSYTLSPGVVTPVQDDSTAVFGYFPTGLVYFIEEFEVDGSVLVPSEESTAFVQRTEIPENVKTGSGSGLILLNSETDYFDAATNWNLVNLPRGQNMYLEIDFKGTQALDIGIKTLNPTIKKVFVAGLKPQLEYTKFYIDLTEAIAREFQSTSVQIYLESRVPVGVDEAEIYIDNLKFILPN